MGLLIGLSIIYTTFRFRPSPQKAFSPGPAPVSRPCSPVPTSAHAKERSGRSSIIHLGLNGTMTPPLTSLERTISGEGGRIPGVGGRGCIWGTEAREYRCVIETGSSDVQRVYR